MSASPRLVGGIGTGTYLLARAGLLRGCRATLHWPYTSLLAEAFPDTVVSSNLFEIDRHRLTCAGGNASVDMMLNWLGPRHNEDLVTELLEGGDGPMKRTAAAAQARANAALSLRNP